MCDYDDAGEDYCLTLRGDGACALITECDPICVSQACTEGFQVVTTEEVVGAHHPERNCTLKGEELLAKGNY